MIYWMELILMYKNMIYSMNMKRIYLIIKLNIYCYIWIIIKILKQTERIIFIKRIIYRKINVFCQRITKRKFLLDIKKKKKIGLSVCLSVLFLLNFTLMQIVIHIYCVPFFLYIIHEKSVNLRSIHKRPSNWTIIYEKCHFREYCV